MAEYYFRDDKNRFPLAFQIWLIYSGCMEGCVVKDSEATSRNSRKEYSVRVGRASINVSHLSFMLFALMRSVVMGMEDLWDVLLKAVIRSKLTQRKCRAWRWLTKYRLRRPGFELNPPAPYLSVSGQDTQPSWAARVASWIISNGNYASSLWTVKH